jgi:AcrR family transcriptional regulator
MGVLHGMGLSLGLAQINSIELQSNDAGLSIAFVSPPGRVAVRARPCLRRSSFVTVDAAAADVQAGADTPTQMLDVAERLFAANGIDKVSIREILRASGQSNLSAAHYHFGSREALIGALMARRIREINIVRHRYLDELESSSRDISALGGVVKSMPWGPDYVRVAAQVILSPRSQVRPYFDPGTMSGQIRCREMLRRLLPQLPPQVFKDRVWILNNETAYGMARWIHAHGPVTPLNSRRFAALIRNTVDFLAAGLAAPVGEKDVSR